MPTVTDYTYSISGDFPNHVVNLGRLTQEVQESTIITALDHMNTNGDICNIWFKDVLSGGDQTTLDGIVAVHSGLPLPNVPEIVNVLYADTTVSSGYVSTVFAVFREVMGSVYNEQTTQSQRSVTSDSANDASAGTGAQTIRITYFDQTMSGPFFEDITLNGLTIINTVANDICFIEKMEVLTVGSAGGNLGNITLFQNPAGGGSTVAIIAAGDSSTFYCHHYVAADKIGRVTGTYGNCVGTPGGTMHVRVTTPSISGSPVKTVAPVARLDPGRQISLSFTSPIAVYGPARISVQVKPDTTDPMNWLTGLNYYEDPQDS